MLQIRLSNKAIFYIIYLIQAINKIDINLDSKIEVVQRKKVSKIFKYNTKIQFSALSLKLHFTSQTKL